MLRNLSIAIAILFLNIPPILSQSSEYNYTQFTVEDGLPSNECHDVVQDSFGYIWIATDKGLVRYDGYELKTYGIKEGLKNISCLRLFLDHENNIWINTFAKKFYKYIPELDSITPFQFNDIIQQINLKSYNSSDFCVDSLSSVYINLLWNGLIIIDKNGIIRHNHGKKGYKYHVQKIKDNYFVCHENIFQNYGIELYKNKPLLTKSIGNKSKATAFGISDNQYFINTDSMNYFIEINGNLDSSYCNGIVDFKRMKNGNFLIARDYNNGVDLFLNLKALKTNKYTSLLQNVSPTRMYVDNSNSLFITTSQDGFFYLKNNSIKSINHHNIVDKSISNIDIFKENLYLVEKEKRLSMFNIKKNIFTPLFNSKTIITNIAAWENENIIINQHPNSFYLTKNKIKHFFYLINQFKLSSFKTEPIDSKSFLLLNKVGVFFYNDIEKPFFKRSYFKKLDLNILSAKLFSPNIYILGTANGVKFYINDHFINEYKGLNITIRVNEIEKKNDQFYIATQGAGLYIWDGVQQLDSITTDNGILSNTIKQVLVDSNQIYLSCQGGISIYDLETKKVRNIEKKHGLLSSQINDMDQDEKYIYLATDKGINVMDKHLKEYPLNQPIIESIYVNNEEFANRSFNLSFDQNNIKINYKTLDYKQKGDITYKCILNNKDSIITKNIDITYPSLSPGTYNFTVQSTNMNGQWGLKREVKFKISPPFWRTISFLTVIGLLFCLLVYLFYRARIKFLKEQLDIQTSLVNLEKSALQAQMNPHFIFNCLNSIQNFINKNNKEEAMEYLSKFAYLIRQMLEASEHSMITLSNEIEMLTNYLELEKLRMNDKFIFNINVDQQIDIKNTIIPVLIIQPYVENAIKHAMNQVAEGIININISKSAEFVNITIEDNGKGFDTESIGQSSKGMKITNSRFENINKLNTAKLDITINSSPKGSTIQIKTPLILS